MNRLFIVDAFTAEPFQGNPAAVCLLKPDASAQWMQALAEEMNLSETAFIQTRTDGYHLRWFTPRYEVDLCGHATLASAHVLWQNNIAAAKQPIRFHTRSGLLTASKEKETIKLDFPATPVQAQAPMPKLAAALGCEVLEYGQTRFDLFARVDSAQTLRDLTPDFQALLEIKTRGLMVTSPSDLSEYDFLSRFFAPSAGINEDPVTGSAHCALATYWSTRLGKKHLRGFQASRRGGCVDMKLHDDRVELGGRAVTVMAGELQI